MAELFHYYSDQVQAARTRADVNMLVTSYAQEMVIHCQALGWAEEAERYRRMEADALAD